MNEKFFDLKKEKQDRMINAALKVFAMNGYGHASTDEIVRRPESAKDCFFIILSVNWGCTPLSMITASDICSLS